MSDERITFDREELSDWEDLAALLPRQLAELISEYESLINNDVVHQTEAQQDAWLHGDRLPSALDDWDGACPVCALPSAYSRTLDRFVHRDGSDNQWCWWAFATEETP